MTEARALNPKTADDDYDYAPPPRKPRWKRRLVIAFSIVLVVLIAAEWIIAAQIAKKLRRTVADKLDAELRVGPILYIPPYSVIAFQPRFVRQNETLFKASRIRLSLAEFPADDRPIVISSLQVNSPELNLAPGAFDDMAKPGGKHLPPKKLSEMLQLKEVRINDGRISVRDPKRPAAPLMSWEGISLSLDTIQQSPSAYSFYLKSRAQQSADATANGTIDVDSLQLDLKNVTVTANAEPEPTRSPLPQIVQEWLKQYRINGRLAVTGNASIPLNTPRDAVFSASVELEDGMADFDKADIAINRLKAAFACAKRAGGPITVQLKTIDALSGAAANRSLLIKQGTLVIDPQAAPDQPDWQLNDVEGNLIVEKRGIEATTYPAIATAPATAPGAPKFEKFQPAGRADFVINASGRFKIEGKLWDAIDHEIVIIPRNASFMPKGFARPIEQINGGEVRIRGGMIVFHELFGTYGNDALRLRAARLPLEGLPKVQSWQEISGSVTFEHPRRPYSPKLDDIFDTLNPTGLFLIGGSYTIDKRETPSKKTYDLIISSDTGSLALTKHKLPLHKVRGDATVTREGVVLHGIEADLLGGRFTATGQWLGETKQERHYDGEIALRDVDLSKLKDVLPEPPPASVKGKLAVQFTFSGTTIKDQTRAERLKMLRASGEMEMVGGDLFKLPGLKQVFERTNMKEAATVGDAAAVFDIADNVVTLRDAGVNAPVLGLQGHGKIGFDGTIDAEVVAAPLADWREKLKETKIPIVSNVTGEIAGHIQKLLNTATGSLLYQFHVTGNLKDKIEVQTVPTPVLTEPGARVFGRMLKATRDQRPLDWFRRDTPPEKTK